MTEQSGIVDRLADIKWGDWSLISLYISLVSGIVVGIHYNPAEPFYSASALDILVPYGAFFRSLHFYSSQLFFFAAVIHYLLVFDKSQTLSTKPFIYLILCFPCILVLLFTGYVLRGDATGFSAGMIAEHILVTIPWIGGPLNNMLFAITDHGMYRVYLHHIISFDLLFLFLAWDHLRRYKANISGQLLFIIVLVLFSLFIAAPMEPDKLGVSYITGPWFFLGLQELLRYIPPFIAGILVPAALIAGLLLLRRDYSWYKSLMMFVCGWLGCYALLTILALTAHG